MRLGYIRLTRAGPDHASQRTALLAAGVGASNIYVDVMQSGAMPARAQAIGSLAAGDELLIVNGSRLGVSIRDILAAVKAVAERQAVLFVLDIQARISWPAEVEPLLSFAEAAEGENRREIATLMRIARVEQGRMGGPPPVDALSLDRARVLWADPRLTADDVARRVKISRRTLFRLLGPRTAR